MNDSFWCNAKILCAFVHCVKLYLQFLNAKLMFHCWRLVFPRCAFPHWSDIFSSYFCMGGKNIAQHTLKGTKKCRLKRDKSYLYDCMGFLYIICCLASIADLLAQKPAVPTRELVSLFCACIFNSLTFHFVFLYIGICVPWQMVCASRLRRRRQES